MSEEIEYEDVREPAHGGRLSIMDAREGDRITFTCPSWSGPHPVTTVVTDATSSEFGGHQKIFAAGWWLTYGEAIIHRIERPVVQIIEEIGTVYGLPPEKDPRRICRVAKVGTDAAGWLASESALKGAAEGSSGRWATRAHVEKLIREHGYVLIGKDGSPA